LPRTLKLERIEIPVASRTVKDWFPTRESVEAVVPAIFAHIRTTGETHTCFCHTHTKPPRDAAVVYIAELAIPKRFRKAGRFCPCPVCWDEFGKFGVGRIAWFPDERVIRIIGEDCFKALSPEGHRQAEELFEEEAEKRRNVTFLLSNVGLMPDVITTIQAALITARAVEQFHELLHDRLKKVHHRLWEHVKRGGELAVSSKVREFRQGADEDMYVREGEHMRVFATLDGYEMLNPKRPHLSNVLERCLERIRPYNYGQQWRTVVNDMSDPDREEAADVLSRAVRAAMDIITKTNKLRKFTERVSINTLRSWGAEKGCPAPFNYQHDGDSILFGSSNLQMVGVPVSRDLRSDLKQIEFWVPMQPRRGRFDEEE
jgi:hypothetical protein